ncbi:alpha/beta hydrolase [Dictyobacter vulcani]|uniref:Alpha/beta hydrolase n=1 Tax=Dictyobacter vulcani TaxID=2607529 RepID=A0A5J4KRR3_9CHLR|nr:alpha/beta hydrolase [Dictyobacter vulcani]GER90585.1 alpha/beta hydrolase [Dictyobacter vulcani]
MSNQFENTPQSQIITLPAGQFHYLSWNAERTDLPACVLLHGITSSSQSWVRVGPALADRYRVFALDMRGHGDSIKPVAGGYTLHLTASDVAYFIQALELQNPVLVGHSWGGATALVLASGIHIELPPPQFSRIILEDFAHNFGHGDPAKRAARFIADLDLPPDELRARLLAQNSNWTAEDIAGKIDAAGKVSKETIISVFADTEAEGELLPLLSKLTAPTLVVRADPAQGSTLDSAAWKEVQQRLPAGSEAVEIPGAAHNIHRSSFTEFMDIVNTFLQKTC